MILTILKYRKLIGIAAGVLAVISVVAMIGYQKHRINSLSIQLDHERATVASYKVTLAELEKDHASAIEAMIIERNQAVARARNLQILIEGAMKDEDGPVAPVLRNVFDRMYAANGTDETD